MAVYTYGTTNLSFGTFYIWSNNVASNLNVTPTSASEIYDNKWFYGSVQISTNGVVDVSGPGSYSLSNLTAGTTQLKNCNLDLGNLVLTADNAAAYPYVFQRWRRGSSGGAEITTSTTLTITSATETSTTIFYAEFN